MNINWVRGCIDERGRVSVCEYFGLLSQADETPAILIG